MKIDVKYQAPEIEGLITNEDQHVNTGEGVKIEFDSEQGARATLVIHMPLTNSTDGLQNTTELPMMEMEDGHYVGYWPATDVNAECAVIEVVVRCLYGHSRS